MGYRCTYFEKSFIKITSHHLPSYPFSAIEKRQGVDFVQIESRAVSSNLHLKPCESYKIAILTISLHCTIHFKAILKLTHHLL
ncbi:hypothetical protein D3C84_612710 [compost metagenome]